MRIIEVILKTFESKRLKATAVINVKNEYFVILPSKKSMLKDIGKMGLDRFFLQESPGACPYRVHLLNGENRAVSLLKQNLKYKRR